MAEDSEDDVYVIPDTPRIQIPRKKVAPHYISISSDDSIRESPARIAGSPPSLKSSGRPSSSIMNGRSRSPVFLHSSSSATTPSSKRSTNACGYEGAYSGSDRYPDFVKSSVLLGASSSNILSNGVCLKRKKSASSNSISPSKQNIYFWPSSSESSESDIDDNLLKIQMKRKRLCSKYTNKQSRQTKTEVDGPLKTNHLNHMKKYPSNIVQNCDKSTSNNFCTTEKISKQSYNPFATNRSRETSSQHKSISSSVASKRDLLGSPTRNFSTAAFASSVSPASCSSSASETSPLKYFSSPQICKERKRIRPYMPISLSPSKPVVSSSAVLGRGEKSRTHVLLSRSPTATTSVRSKNDWMSPEKSDKKSLSPEFKKLNSRKDDKDRKVLKRKLNTAVSVPCSSETSTSHGTVSFRHSGNLEDLPPCVTYKPKRVAHRPSHKARNQGKVESKVRSPPSSTMFSSRDTRPGQESEATPMEVDEPGESCVTPPPDSIGSPIGATALTPHTHKAVQEIQQLQKDEDMARALQEELDREYAMSLQHSPRHSDHPPAFSFQGLPADPLYGEAGSRDTGAGSQESPPRHFLSPVMSRRGTRARVPRRNAITDTQHILENIQHMLSSPAHGRRRGRGHHNQFMLFSPAASGSDYESLMNLGEMLGEVKDKGLTEAQSNMLPVISYKQGEKTEECHICMADFEELDSVKMLPCFHSYHAACINKWIKKNATCPVCRVEIKIDAS